MKILKVYIERGLEKNKVVLNAISKLREVQPLYFNKLSEITRTNITKDFFVKDTLIFAVQRGNFVINCPCSPGQIRCGYHIVDWGLGCTYRCSYCYLNYYQNIPGILIYVNLNDCFRELDKILQNTKGVARVGTGEFVDSLALDPVVNMAAEFIKYFAAKKNALLELKTKSANVDNLLRLKHNGNTVISWSVNPQSIISNEENSAPSLSSRLGAARKAQKSGYKIAFHFDPIIFSQGWENNYARTVKELFKYVSPESIAWISLGTLRFHTQHKNILNQYYNSNIQKIGEFVVGQDGKMRYFRPVRRKIYEHLIDNLSKYLPLSKIYLCMESKEMWADLQDYTKFNYKQHLWV